MIKEYRTQPQSQRDDANKRDVITWHNRRSIDLRCVSSATPLHGYDIVGVCWNEPDIAGTIITLQGMQFGFPIDEDYERFMRDWQSVKR